MMLGIGNLFGAPANFGIAAPCKDCEERHPHCHSECEKYLAFRKKLEAVKKEALSRKKVDEAYMQTRYRKKKRGQK